MGGLRRARTVGGKVVWGRFVGKERSVSTLFHWLLGFLGRMGPAGCLRQVVDVVDAALGVEDARDVGREGGFWGARGAGEAGGWEEGVGVDEEALVGGKMRDEEALGGLEGQIRGECGEGVVVDGEEVVVVAADVDLDGVDVNAQRV